jgi:hypothetical protein
MIKAARSVIMPGFCREARRASSQKKHYFFNRP